MMKSKASALYLHIPFCKNICSYCDFKKFIYNQKWVDEYFQSLFFDLSHYENNRYKTIYIGGGTPSCIDKVHLKQLLEKVSALLKDNYEEFTIECNVEDINEDFLSLIKAYKVNRLSVGIQTFNEKYIQYCNRHHTKQMAIDKVILANQYIKNISIDMIYAFQGQTIKELKKDLSIALTLPIKHISYYSLLIEPGTVLYNNKTENVDDLKQAKMYEVIYKALSANGFLRYEISNFSKGKKYQSKHNKVYWHNQHYDAVGIAASGYIDNVRFTNNKNIIKYMNNDYTLSEKTILSKEDILFDQIMLNLRLDEGLNINKVNKKFHIDFLEKYKQPIKTLKKHRLITIQNNIMKTTFRGSLLLNSVLELFME